RGGCTHRRRRAGAHPRPDPAPADGPAIEHGGGADLPAGLERLPLAARRDLIAQHHDHPARAVHLPERALHPVARADGRDSDQPTTGTGSFCCRTTVLRQLNREYGDQMRTARIAAVVALCTMVGTAPAF